MLGRARILRRLDPRLYIQGIVVLLNVHPFRRWLHALYAFGLRRMVAALVRHPAVHSIYGHGSFFTGDCLYGHSDIDLVIVLKESQKRSEGAQFRIARLYNRVRRFFPFLGNWDEKEGSLIFLSEVVTGFPPHATFRIRQKTGELLRLCGEPFPVDFGGGPPSQAELVEEINRLLRWAVLMGERRSYRLLFWQRMFSKLSAVACQLGQAAALEPRMAGEEFAFLRADPRMLFFRSADPGRLFPLFMEMVHRLLDGVRVASEPVRLRYRPLGAAPAAGRRAAPPPFCSGLLVERSEVFPSGPIGIAPNLFYFSVDEPMPVLRIGGNPYRSLRSLVKRMAAQAGESESVLVEAADYLFLLTRQSEYVDVQPLDPLTCANVYARIAGSLECDVPRGVAEPLRAEAEGLFAALRDAYERHTGWLPTQSYPAIYREDDLDLMRDAFDILWAYVAHHGECVYARRSEELVGYLSARHPESADFLAILMKYRRFLENGSRGRPPANNLYRCLHQFVSGVLSGGDSVVVREFNRHISITVGIVTRNRASDLRNALESLALQIRPPDEVLVVDNGSTDDTRSVAESFEGRLPLRYLHLAEASIPLARNLVIDNATQEVISFTDDDCGIPPEWLSSVERGFLRADNIGLVGGWVEHWPAEVRTTVDTYYSIFHNHKT